MLLRLWRAEFDHERLDELNEFARTRSGPMFDSLPGCMGHIFSHSAGTYLTISMWIGDRAIKQAEASDIYRETVAAITASGILRGDQVIEVFDVDGVNFGRESEPDEADGPPGADGQGPG